MIFKLTFPPLEVIPATGSEISFCWIFFQQVLLYSEWFLLKSWQMFSRLHLITHVWSFISYNLSWNQPLILCQRVEKIIERIKNKIKMPYFACIFLSQNLLQKSRCSWYLNISNVTVLCIYDHCSLHKTVGWQLCI